MSTKIKGYKAFNKDLVCRDYQYEIGKVHVYLDRPAMCVSGFHYCVNPLFISQYYNWIDNPDIRIFEIEAGYSLSDDYKSVTNQIQLVREISRDEMNKLCTGVFEFDHYTQAWYVNGILHREDGPAIIYDKNEEWYFNGKLHRTDGPAVSKSNGVYKWYVNGILHREGGPAVVTSAMEEWYLNGLLHREDGPAVVYFNNSIKRWYKHGKLHREGGPAVIYNYGEEWYFDGQLHREDGPALKDGYVESWYKHGKLHREGGPALITPYVNEWHVNGEMQYKEF